MRTLLSRVRQREVRLQAGHERLARPDGQAGSGAADGFEEAVLLHFDAAYRLARYLTRRDDIAEDIVQEALVRAYRSFASARSDNTRAWLLAIVRNCFLTWNARNVAKRAEASGTEPEKAVGALQDQETPGRILIQREESNTVRALVEELRKSFREVLVLRDIEDMSYREIADIVGVPAGTVMSRLARARKMFAAAWKSPGIMGPKEMKR